MDNITQKLQQKKNQEMKEATDLLARLLAVEKLTVIDGGCTTSSIDLDNRVINVVRFEDDSPLTCKEVRITCIAHEVGHAIFTPLSLLHKHVDEKYPNLFPYINLVEDIRIENLIKGRYRGIHSMMKAGRKIMFENGYYGAQSLSNVNSLPIFDKILLYTKIDKNINGLVLSSMDEAIVRYIKVHAIDEDSVIKCAKILYLYCKEKKELDQETQPAAKGGEKSSATESGDNAEGDSNSEESTKSDGADGDESDDDSESDNFSEVLGKLSQKAKSLKESDVEKPRKTIEEQMEKMIAKNASSEIVSFAKKGEVSKLSKPFVSILKL